MIRSKIEAFYEAKGVKKAIIQIEVETFVQNKEGINFNVFDYAIKKEILYQNIEGEDIETEIERKEMITSYTVFKTNAQIQAINDHLKLAKDYSEMDKTDRDWKKIQDALFWFVTNKTYDNGMTDYRLLPDNWELI